MAEWLVEEGIGEERAVLLRHDRVIAARLYWPGSLTAGQVEEAQLISRPGGSGRGVARFSNGAEALVDRLPKSASEGALLRLEVTRASIPEAGRRKMAQARPTTLPLQAAPSLAQQLTAEGFSPKVVRRFPTDVDWLDIWADASDGRVGFAGGALLFYATPAMTLVDVDGEAEPFDLAKSAVPVLAEALRKFDLAGSIGIDFPTLREKSQRKAVDALLADALNDWPHERTAINGFGFVQLVSRMTRSSLLACLMHDPAGAAARRLLREAEGLHGAGAVELRCSPRVAAAMRPLWITELGRRTGRRIAVEVVGNQLDPSIGSAQLVPHD